MTAGATTAAGYAARARHYAAEIGGLPEPRLLRPLLQPGLRLAEIPSATGHFLPVYAAAGCDVTLIDGCADMLANAHRPDLPAPRTRCCLVQDLAADTAMVDLAVVPNAALNQLAAQTEPTRLLTAISQILAGDGLLLLQVLVRDGDGMVNACRFYDPAAADGTWQTDRHWTDATGRHLQRRRRQKVADDLLRLDLEFTDGTGLLHAHSVDLRLLARSDLDNALAGAHLTLIDSAVGADGMTEILARRSTLTMR